MKSPIDYNKENKEFINRVSKLTSGDLATLRRNVDNPLTNVKAMPILAKISSLNSFEKSLVACLYAVYHKENESPYFSDEFNFGTSLYFSLKGDSPDFKPEDHDKRLKSILSSTKDELPFKLRQIVKLIKSKEQKIDFSYLLKCLYNWDNEEKWIQREWVRGFYNIKLNIINEGEKENEQSEVN